MKITKLTTLFIALLGISINAFSSSPIDLTIVGTIKFRDGLGRIPIGLVDILKDDISINCFSQKGFYNLTDVPLGVQTILENSDKTPGNVGIYFNLRKPSDHNFFIKIAYSLFEATRIPSKWVRILNEHFDAVVVADRFYCDAYKKSGVTIPVFALPHGIYIEELLRTPIHTAPANPFVFGCTSTFYPRKNQPLLLKAFHKEFGNDPKVRLRLHGRAVNKKLFKGLQANVEKWGATNIDIEHSVLSDKLYQEFLKSLDCYVLVSKGEGYSVTPREALALGTPCILSNNTAHHTICDTNYVYSVPSNRAEPAYSITHKEVCGEQFDCTVEDVQKALREVYTNYELYTFKAQEGKRWVQSYLWKNLHNRFLTRIKPKKVLLGETNNITDEYIITDSPDLYHKYSTLIN